MKRTRHYYYEDDGCWFVTNNKPKIGENGLLTEASRKQQEISDTTMLSNTEVSIILGIPPDKPVGTVYIVDSVISKL